jgi:RNA polymerase sigma factor (sigma-70 family)
MKNIDKLISESKSDSLTQEEEIRLFTIYINRHQGWQEAKDTIAESCLLYVVKCAHGYSGYLSNLEDLVCEGTLGLLEAIDRFELNQGARFLTFASFSIKGRMLKFLAKASFCSALSVPVDASKITLNIKSFIEKTEIQTGETPSKAVIAKHFDFDEHTLNYYLSLLDIKTFSLNSSYDDSSNNVIEIEDTNVVLPSATIQNDETKEILEGIISKLPKRQRIIINKRFGFDNNERQCLSEIGEELALTKQRVAQIEAEALETIRKEIKKTEINLQCLQ